jgi:hypothetical protein
VVTFAPQRADFDAEAFRSAAIGPSGNLRAPTLRVGSTWFIGFSADAYADGLG